MSFFDDEKKKDWKDCLTDSDREVLQRIEAGIKRFSCAWDHADNPEIAKLWTALIEMRKELDSTKDMLGKLEAPWQAIISAGEAEKKKTIERMVSEMVRPTDAETQEATRKLVESLMRF
jgi:hypothetical protein